MKKMSWLIPIGITILLIATAFESSKDHEVKEYVFVTYTLAHTNSTSMLTISYSDGTTESRNLKASKTNNEADNAKTINTVINELRDKGYTIETSSGGDIRNMIVFKK